MVDRVIQLKGRGGRGESFADVARRVGIIGNIVVPSTATDAQVLALLSEDLTEVVAAAGYTVYDSVAVATSANITLSGEQTIDGILTSADRVLVKNQTVASENGLYLSAAGAWSRTTDFDGPGEAVQGAYVLVDGGTQAGGWVLTTDDPITIGTTDQVWRQFSISSEAVLPALAATGGAALIGVANLTGVTVPDDSNVQGALQALETAVETKANASAVGVTASAADMGTYTGTTIPDNQTAKQNIQSLETAHEGYVSDVASLASGKGAGLVGFSHASTYAAGTDGKKLQQFVDPRDEPHNAVGDGATDDAAALASALATGKKVWLQSDVTYAFGTQLTPPAGGGFIGGGNLLMLTGSGKFDAASYAGGFDANKIGIYALSIDDITLDLKITMEANASVRTCSAIALRDCDNAVVNVEASGFDCPEFGIVQFDTCQNLRADVNVHDCGTDDTSIGSTPQITGCVVDADRVSGVNSVAPRINGRFVNIRLGATAGAAYGEQTDGLNIQTTGYSGAICNVYAENVGEPFDCFGDNVIAHVVAKDALNYGVKLIHGASFCNITGTVSGCGINGLVIGSDNTTKSCNRNYVNMTINGVGEVTTPTTFTTTAAFATDGDSAIYPPTNNTIVINGNTNGAYADYAVDIVSGSGNMVEADTTLSFNLHYGRIGSLARSVTTTSGSPNLTSVNTAGLVAGMSISGTGIPAGTTLVSVDTGASTAVMSANASASGTITMTAKLYKNIIRRRQNTYIRAYVGTATTVAQNATVPYDTEVTDITNEFDPSTYTATVRCAGRYKVSAQCRANSVPTLEQWGLAIMKNGSEAARFTPINPAASSREVWVSAERVLDCDAGDTITVKCIATSAGPFTITNQSPYSFLEIEQI